MVMPHNDGFDVSHYQGANFPWTWSRNEGHDLASCKATEGIRFVDPTFAHNRDAMASAGFRYRGMYCWIKPRLDVAAQVDHFVATVGDLALGEFVQIDCEEAPLTAGQMWTAFSALSERYPGRVIVYAGFFFAGWTSDPRFANCPWWLAWYGPATFDDLQARAAKKKRPLPWQPIVWQWGGGAEGDSVPGSEKGVDSNQIIDRDALESLAGYTNPPPTGNGNKTALATRDRLGVGEGLARGDQLVSTDGSSILVHQLDGNVVIYRGDAVWATETCGQDTTVLTLQDDGNIVLEGADAPVWASDSFGSGGTTLVMQDDANVVLYAAGGPVWSSSSAVAPRTITVEPGDGWIAIAERVGCDRRELASVNGGERRMLHPGDLLVLPQSAARVSH
jgi:GH25 family lysozyme M1 (1,4-beta-N-acetylmuramidase)